MNETVEVPIQNGAEPLMVRCEPVDLFTLMDVMGCLPGAFPPAPEGEEPKGGYAGAWASLKPKAAALIGASCTPRFAPGDEQYPLEALGEHEQFTLCATILHVSGWIGGPADRVARFPRVGSGGSAGLRNGGPEESTNGSDSGMVAYPLGSGAAAIGPAPQGEQR